jgi:hypothetical protein
MHTSRRSELLGGPCLSPERVERAPEPVELTARFLGECGPDYEAGAGGLSLAIFFTRLASIHRSVT